MRLPIHIKVLSLTGFALTIAGLTTAALRDAADANLWFISFSIAAVSIVIMLLLHDHKNTAISQTKSDNENT